MLTAVNIYYYLNNLMLNSSNMTINNEPVNFKPLFFFKLHCMY